MVRDGTVHRPRAALIRGLNYGDPVSKKSPAETMGAQLGDVRSSDLIERLRQQMAPPQVSAKQQKHSDGNSVAIGGRRRQRTGSPDLARLKFPIKNQSLGGGASLERTRLWAQIA